MKIAKQLHRITKLGVSNFETVEKVERAQADLLDRLRASPVRSRRYRDLSRCSATRCGTAECTEACYFGTFRRRLQEVPAALRLLQKAGPPFHEVRIMRASWRRPLGQLNTASIVAAKQLNRRALDSLYDPSIVAVGTFEVAPVPPCEGQGWICEIHQIVAGAKKEDLERIFSTRRDRGEIKSRSSGPINNLMIREVDALAPKVSEVLRRDIRGWQHPWRREIPPTRPKKAERSEFYRWLLDLHPGMRLIRYGCDRYFNLLGKQPRAIKPKVPKKRPSPWWLEPYQFGHGKWRDIDPNSMEYAIIKARRS
jgi:hypothetical protein